MDFSARLNLLVEDSGLNGKAFAERVGIPYATFHKYWRKGREPSGDALAAICIHMDINGHWLLTGDGAMRPAVAHQISDKPAPQGVDSERLGMMLREVEEHLDKGGMVLEPAKKAKLVALLYDYFEGRAEIEQRKVVEFLRLVA